jgi:hypothetical protein
VTRNNTRNHIFEYPLHVFIFVPSLRTFESVKLMLLQT